LIADHLVGAPCATQNMFYFITDEVTHIQGVRSVRFSLLRLTINTCNICEFLMNSSIKPHVYKVKKTNRVSYIYVSFLQKSPTLSVSLAERDKQLSLCVASRMWIRYRSVVIVPPEGGVEFSAGLTKKDCVLCMSRLEIVSGFPHTLPPPHKKHFCGRLLLEDRERSEKDRRVYPLHSLRLTLFFFLQIDFLLCK